MSTITDERRGQIKEALRKELQRLREVEQALAFQMYPLEEVPSSNKIGLFNQLHSKVQECLERRKAGIDISAERDAMLRLVFQACLGSEGCLMMERLAEWSGLV